MRARVLFRLALAVLTSVWIVGAASPAASAHTTIKGANPTAGEVVTEQIDRLEIDFFVPVTEPVITLTSPSGETLPGTVAMTDANALAYDVSPLAEAGEYIVEWSVVTPDGHRDSAAYSFRYEPVAAPPEQLPAASQSPDAGADPPDPDATTGESVSAGAEPASHTSATTQSPRIVAALALVAFLGVSVLVGMKLSRGRRGASGDGGPGEGALGG